MKHILVITVDSEANVKDTATVYMKNMAEDRVEFAEQYCDIERAISVTRQFMETCRRRRQHAEGGLK